MHNLRLARRSASAHTAAAEPPRAGADPLQRPGDDVLLPLQQRMAQAWKHYPGPKLVVLSGNDYTAKEFVETTASDALWRANVAQANVSRLDVAGADHTFSDPADQRLVEQRTLAWLLQCLGAQTAAAATAQDHAYATPTSLGVL